jgi:hypothetical protein
MSNTFNVGDIIQENEDDPICLVIGNEELAEDKRIKQYRLLVLEDMERDYNHHFGYLNSDNTFVQSIHYVDAWFKRVSE